MPGFIWQQSIRAIEAIGQDAIRLRQGEPTPAKSNAAVSIKIANRDCTKRLYRPIAAEASLSSRSRRPGQPPLA
jgi:hypothetical protein